MMSNSAFSKYIKMTKCHVTMESSKRPVQRISLQKTLKRNSWNSWRKNLAQFVIFTYAAWNR